MPDKCLAGEKCCRNTGWKDRNNKAYEITLEKMKDAGHKTRTAAGHLIQHQRRSRCATT